MKNLNSNTYTMLPLGSVKPLGWLKKQLRIQADGLSGHLDEFWPDIKDSAWFGGRAEGWERAPYWLDGLIPLAWVLDDDNLKAKAKECVDYIVAHQKEDGWLGPGAVDGKNLKPDDKYDIWALFLANKMLCQYHEATGDPGVLEAVKKCLKMCAEHMDRQPLFGWGMMRWFEALISIYYVYEQTGEEWLLDLADKHRKQGFDWKAFFRTEDITVPTPRRGMWRWDKHVVNLAMALKTYPMCSRMNDCENDRQTAADMIRVLDKYHGQVTGVFTGDECIAGKNPLQGTELCSVAEYMYSLEHLLSALGDPEFGDRLERITFNAWPATFSPDMWGHQYVQQVNQVQCTINPEYLWSTNGPDSNLYGLEPNYGCCTSNMHQGWPKFAANLWMKTADGGLAAVAYAPSKVDTKIKGISVCVTLETDYPFRDTLAFTVKTATPVEFPLTLRIPEWTTNAELTVAAETLSPRAGSFHTVNRVWEGETVITLKLPMHVKTQRRYNDAVSIERGPLVYSLKIEEEWIRVNKDLPCREKPHADYEVRPTTPWNYALIMNESDPETSVVFEESEVGDCPFSPDGAPITAKIKGRKLPGWQLQSGWAGETPLSPVTSDEPTEDLTLIPYGCTDIRITEFPIIG